MISEQQILSAAPWYQEGLSISICEDYLLDEDQPEGAFIIHRSFHQDRWILVLSVKTNEKTVFHYPIEKQLGYRLKVSRSFLLIFLSNETLNGIRMYTPLHFSFRMVRKCFSISAIWSFITRSSKKIFQFYLFFLDLIILQSFVLFVSSRFSRRLLLVP